MDIHALDPTQNKGIDAQTVRVQPYDIPLRALISREVPNLMMAGRCISGDFVAHASYRVTGNAAAMGEAAGIAAALSAREHMHPGTLPFDRVKPHLPPLA